MAGEGRSAKLIDGYDEVLRPLDERNGEDASDMGDGAWRKIIHTESLSFNMRFGCGHLQGVHACSLKHIFASTLYIK